MLLASINMPCNHTVLQLLSVHTQCTISYLWTLTYIPLRVS